MAPCNAHIGSQSSTTHSVTHVTCSCCTPPRLRAQCRRRHSIDLHIAGEPQPMPPMPPMPLQSTHLACLSWLLARALALRASPVQHIDLQTFKCRRSGRYPRPRSSTAARAAARWAAWRRRPAVAAGTSANKSVTIGARRRPIIEVSDDREMWCSCLRVCEVPCIWSILDSCMLSFY